MIGQGKVVGTILIVIALIIAIIAGLYLFSGLAEGRLRLTGFVLGMALVAIVALPVLGMGAFMLVRGRGEVREFAEVEKEKRLLNVVQAQGKVNVADLAIEMNVTRDQVKSYIYDLVGKGLFTGYINWNEGVLYAREAKEMQTNKCPNCGGLRELVGKGVVKCPFCGSELFL